MRHPLLSVITAAAVITLTAACAEAIEGAPRAATVLTGAADTGTSSASSPTGSGPAGPDATGPGVTTPPTAGEGRTGQSMTSPPVVTATVTVTEPGADSHDGSSDSDSRPADRSSMTTYDGTDPVDTSHSVTRSGNPTRSGQSTTSRHRPARTVDAPTQATGQSTATVSAHGITVAVGKPSGVVDFYEDALCPICGQFEAQYGAVVRQAIDNGALSVRYRMVDFLNPYSASGSYSTRAFAAMLSLTRIAGDQPGLVEAFHTSLFDASIQPEEKGTEDLSNATLADLAAQLGAPDKAVAAIASGADVDRATTFANANLQRLKRISDNPGTPTVARGSTVIPLTDDWLDTVLDGSG